MPTKPQLPVAAAATALEDEFDRLRQLADTAGRTKLTSRKNLLRAQKALADAFESQLRVAECMKGLAGALQAAGEENTRLISDLAARKEEVELRVAQVEHIVARFEQLGQVVAQLSTMVRRIGEEEMNGAPTAEAVATLAHIEESMNGVVVVAEQLLLMSRQLEVSDLVSEIDAMRQGTDASRKKVQSVRAKFAERIGRA